VNHAWTYRHSQEQLSALFSHTLPPTPQKANLPNCVSKPNRKTTNLFSFHKSLKNPTVTSCHGSTSAWATHKAYLTVWGRPDTAICLTGWLSQNRQLMAVAHRQGRKRPHTLHKSSCKDQWPTTCVRTCYETRRSQRWSFTRPNT